MAPDRREPPPEKRADHSNCTDHAEDGRSWRLNYAFLCACLCTFGAGCLAVDLPLVMLAFQDQNKISNGAIGLIMASGHLLVLLIGDMSALSKHGRIRPVFASVSILGAGLATCLFGALPRGSGLVGYAVFRGVKMYWVMGIQCISRVPDMEHWVPKEMRSTLRCSLPPICLLSDSGTRVLSAVFLKYCYESVGVDAVFYGVAALGILSSCLSMAIYGTLVGAIAPEPDDKRRGLQSGSHSPSTSSPAEVGQHLPCSPSPSDELSSDLPASPFVERHAVSGQSRLSEQSCSGASGQADDEADENFVEFPRESLAWLCAVSGIVYGTWVVFTGFGPRFLAAFICQQKQQDFDDCLVMGDTMMDAALRSSAFTLSTCAGLTFVACAMRCSSCVCGDDGLQQQKAGGNGGKLVAPLVLSIAGIVIVLLWVSCRSAPLTSDAATGWLAILGLLMAFPLKFLQSVKVVGKEEPLPGCLRPLFKHSEYDAAENDDAQVRATDILHASNHVLAGAMVVTFANALQHGDLGNPEGGTSVIHSGQAVLINGDMARALKGLAGVLVIALCCAILAGTKIQQRFEGQGYTQMNQHVETDRGVRKGA